MGHPGASIGMPSILEATRPDPCDRLVLQVSRCDTLKDPVGVMTGFERHIADRTDAHLVLAGPSADSVADDPEGAQVLRQVHDTWQLLAPDARRRVHIASLPMADAEENAAIVNALQRHAEVVVQKSLAEGFGLTVAEAMWKQRPVWRARPAGSRTRSSTASQGSWCPTLATCGSSRTPSSGFWMIVSADGKWVSRLARASVSIS